MVHLDDDKTCDKSKIIEISVSHFRFKYRLRWLSRIFYCRGFGVQSPSAYRFIRYVINEHYPYYAYDDLRKEFPETSLIDEKIYRLYFRVANFMQPCRFINYGKPAEILSRYVNAGCRCTEIINIEEMSDASYGYLTDGAAPLLLRVNLYEGAYDRPLSLIDNMPENAIMMVDGIKHNRRTRNIWRQLRDDTRTGVTFDLYYCGIVFFDKRIKQNYIVNF